jgi:hypothetical protein
MIRKIRQKLFYLFVIKRNKILFFFRYLAYLAVVFVMIKISRMANIARGYTRVYYISRRIEYSTRVSSGTSTNTPGAVETRSCD